MRIFIGERNPISPPHSINIYVQCPHPSHFNYSVIILKIFKIVKMNNHHIYLLYSSFFAKTRQLCEKKKCFLICISICQNFFFNVNYLFFVLSDILFLYLTCNSYPSLHLAAFIFISRPFSPNHS
jgi:hypothetical protein